MRLLLSNVRRACVAAIAVTVLAGPIAHATTAATVFQNRDEPGRNVYQTVGSTCKKIAGQPNSCVISFGGILDTQQVVVQHINCLLHTTGFGGITVNLYGDHSLKDYMSFQPVARSGTTGPTSVIDYPLDAPIVFYGKPAGGLEVILVANDPFSGDQHCILTGYHVTIP
jgi:hypothetical protein